MGIRAFTKEENYEIKLKGWGKGCIFKQNG